MKWYPLFALSLVVVVVVVWGSWHFAKETVALTSFILGITIPLVVNVPTFLFTRWMVIRKSEDFMKAVGMAFVARMLLYGFFILVAGMSVSLRFSPFTLAFTVIFVFLLMGEALYFLRLFSSQKPIEK